MLFNGTVRQNIDPYNKHSERELVTVLQRIGLDKRIPSLELRIGENGIQFSAGEKQLICLARAAVNHCKILVLDEATSNLDTHFDMLFRDILDRIFKNCTVLSIFHKEVLISTCDQVLLLDNGKIVKFGGS